MSNVSVAARTTNLAALVAEALAIADALELHSVAIRLDEARQQLDQVQSGAVLSALQ